MAGVKLTKHDTFLPRSDFMQLVYACCSPARPGLTDQADLLVPPPTIWKPEPLWTGKQVIPAFWQPVLSTLVTSSISIPWLIKSCCSFGSLQMKQQPMEVLAMRRCDRAEKDSGTYASLALMLVGHHDGAGTLHERDASADGESRCQGAREALEQGRHCREEAQG